MRKKLERWNLLKSGQPIQSEYKVRQWTPGWMARTAVQRLQRLSKLCNPRIQAAIWSYILDRWSTGRMMQQKRKCLICNDPSTRDEPEHFPYCAVLRPFAASALRVNLRKHGNLQAWTLTSHDYGNDDSLMKIGIWVYVTYRCYNYLRTASQKLEGEQLQRALTQWLKEAARDTPRIQKLLHTISQNSQGARGSETARKRQQNGQIDNCIKRPRKA